MRGRQVPLVLAARRAGKSEDVERSSVTEEVWRSLRVRLVRKVVLPESVDLIGGYRLVLGPVEVAWSLITRTKSATIKQAVIESADRSHA